MLVEFRVLGPLEVGDNQRVLRLGGPRQRALLALFLMRPGQFISADKLADDLWEGCPPESAANALRVHITHLRDLLEPGRRRNSPSVRLPAASSGYRLLIDPEELDSLRFERMARLGRDLLAQDHRGEALTTLEQALGLWRGPAFADTRDLTRLRTETTRLEEMRNLAMENWAEANLALGRHAALVGNLETIVADEPLRERFTVHLMLALYRSGRQAEALRACARLRRSLRDELGIDPSSTVSALEQSILLQRPELDWTSSGTTAEGPGPIAARQDSRRRWETFVGRNAELGQLDEAFEQVRAGRSRAVFLLGVPGVGKTALARAFGGRAVDAGALCLYGHCDPEPTGPYQPLAEAVGELLAAEQFGGLLGSLGPLAAELVRLVPRLATSIPEPSAVADDADRYRLFEAVASALRAARCPIVLVLDDLHWADMPTILLMRHLVRHPDAGQLLIVGTYRSGEVGPTHPLIEPSLRLITEGVADRIELGGLEKDDVDRLLRSYAPADVLASAPATIAETMQEVTGGNPLFVREVVRHLVDHQIDLTRPELVRSLAPDGIRPLVAQRIACLSKPAGRALRIAAVVGQDFDLRLLSEATKLDDNVLLEALEEGLAAGLVVEGTGGIDHFAFSHALIRNVIHRDLAQSRRARLHLRVAEAMEALDEHAGSTGRIMELAHHFIEAASLGVADKAVRHTIAAVDAALASLAFEDAVELCHRGLRTIADADPAAASAPTPSRCDLLVRLGRAQLRSGDKAGRESLLSAFAIARELYDHLRMGEAALGLNRGFFARVGRVDAELVEILETALAAQPPGDRPLVAELMATLASELVWAVDGDRRFALSDQALGMARRLGSQATLARVLLLRNMTVAAPDTVSARTQGCQELWELAERLRDPGLQFQAAFHRSGTAMESGDIVVANQMVDQAYKLANECRQPALLWQAGFMRTSRRILQGALDEAEQLARATLELGHKSNQGGEAFIFYSEQMLEIRRWQDRLNEMLSDFKELAGVEGVDLGYSLVRYLFDAKEEGAARGCYETIMTKGDLPPRRDMLQLTALGNLAYLASRAGDLTGARTLETSLRPFGRVMASTTVAKPVGSHYLGMLARALGDVESAERHFRIALGIHRDAAAPLLAAETQLEWAHALVVARAKPSRVGVLLDDAKRTADAFGARFLQRRCSELRAGIR